MSELLEDLKPELAAGTRAFFVHPEGTRSQSCREPVTKISSLFLDLAIELDIPIVPIRISGGLPVEPIVGKLEFPIAHAPQDYTIGTPISAQELGTLGYAERGRRVLAALNTLGPPLEDEEPNVGDPDFSARIKKWQKETGASEIEATFLRVLQDAPVAGEEAVRLIEGARRRSLRVGTDPKSAWLGQLASRLYGPKGPKVKQG